MAIATINPATGELVKKFDALSPEELDARLERASQAFRRYRRTSVDERVGWLRAAADVLDADNDRVAAMMTLEMGKTLTAAKAEASKCAKALRYFADHGPAMLEPTSRPTRSGRAPTRPTSPTSRSASCWRSCRGTSRCGRRCASPRPR